MYFRNSADLDLIDSLMQLPGQALLAYVFFSKQEIIISMRLLFSRKSFVVKMLQFHKRPLCFSCAISDNRRRRSRKSGMQRARVSLSLSAKPFFPNCFNSSSLPFAPLPREKAPLLRAEKSARDDPSESNAVAFEARQPRFTDILATRAENVRTSKRLKSSRKNVRSARYFCLFSLSRTRLRKAPVKASDFSVSIEAGFRCLIPLVKILPRNFQFSLINFKYFHLAKLTVSIVHGHYNELYNLYNLYI